MESLHEEGFIHGDINPNNFCLSKSRSNGKNLPSNIRISLEIIRGQIHPLASISISTNVSPVPGLSRRDDLESFAFTLMDLTKQGLPWNYLVAVQDIISDFEATMDSPDDDSDGDSDNDMPDDSDDDDAIIRIQSEKILRAKLTLESEYRDLRDNIVINLTHGYMEICALFVVLLKI
ncbi:hypothetical protein M422DRAFT_55951 [Sphaerobolus stellatus SS14]|uniref:Protein kinase domain-containing protein n=1 Tax=Sphaerobolus stellatus (strain SS14) TaxID=990650 RepID=A0A0C9UJT3_SPHS4|nr:hypothetical protein M422DRAFT_55951 [Sphaerobolus stellatus SS14]